MMEIPRYRMTNSLGHQDNENVEWVRYEDHAAAVEAAVLAESIRLGGIIKQLHETSNGVPPTRGQQFTNRPVVPIVLAEPPQPPPAKWGWK